MEGEADMKQPTIKIFGKEHKVKQIEFNDEGVMERIVYQVMGNVYRSIFKSDTMLNKSLTTERKIQKPTQHPFHDYVYAPDLESLLVRN